MRLMATTPATLPATPTTTHLPAAHLADTDFDKLDANEGIAPPVRRLTDEWGRPASVAPSNYVETAILLVCTSVVLEIANLDKADPPGYVEGKLCRGDAFNGNDFLLTKD